MWSVYQLVVVALLLTISVAILHIGTALKRELNQIRDLFEGNDEDDEDEIDVVLKDIRRLLEQGEIDEVLKDIILDSCSNSKLQCRRRKRETLVT